MGVVDFEGYLNTNDKGMITMIKKTLKNLGEKMAEAPVDARSQRHLFFEPKPPAKLQERRKVAK